MMTHSKIATMDFTCIKRNNEHELNDKFKWFNGHVIITENRHMNAYKTQNDTKAAQKLHDPQIDLSTQLVIAECARVRFFIQNAFARKIMSVHGVCVCGRCVLDRVCVDSFAIYLP